MTLVFLAQLVCQSVSNGYTLGLVHIEVYAIWYSLYAICFALRHRQDSATSMLHHLNVACGGEQIV